MTKRGCGLFRVYAHKPQKTKPIPLQSVSFDCLINNSFATAQISQKFVNIETKPIEVEYFFPISDSAVVTGLQVQLDDGRVLNAKVEEETRAKEFYEDAMSEGNTVYMAQESTPDRMRLSIGNMAPGCGAIVLVTISFPVATSEGKWEFFLPASLTPLCAGGNAAPGPGSIRPRNCTYDLNFSLRINSRETISEIASTSHPLIIENEGLSAVITMDPEQEYHADKDLRISYVTASAGAPNYQVEYDPETQTYAAAVSLLPTFLEPGEDADDLEGSGEFIFVLDRSGSMNGARMDLAKEAAILFLKSLPENSKFNIVSFGTRYDSLFQTPVPYNDKSMSRAIEKIQGFTANYGGTNIYNPLQGIFAQRTNAPRQVFLLTDGVVRNPEETVDLIQANERNSRVHAFGIGDGVSTYLIKNCARAGRGKAEFIAQGENIQSKVISVLRQALVPALINWNVSWNGAALAPRRDHQASVYYNEVFTLYANLGINPTSGPVTLEYTNSRYDRVETTTIDVDISTAIHSNQMHKLWAKERIRELEFRARQHEDVEGDIVKLSKEYGVPSKFTAYICVEKKDDPVTWECQLRKVPIVITGDRQPAPKVPLRQPPAPGAANRFPLFKSASRGAARSKCVARPSMQAKCISRPAMEAEELEGCVEDALGMEFEEEKQEKRKSGLKKKKKSVAKKSKQDSSESHTTSLDLEIIKLQNANGSWGPEVFDIIKISTESTLEDMTQWATAVVIMWLKQKFPENEESWYLVVRKAVKWLKANQVDYTSLPINFNS